MSYKYNITHKQDKVSKTINFKNKQGMLKYLNTNQKKLSKLQHVMLNFSSVSLPLKATVWNDHG